MERLGQVRILRQLVAGGIGHQLKSSPAAVVIQNRGGKTKYGGITRDPLIHMKQKLAQQNKRRQTKVPLMSEERKQSRVTLPVNATSLSKQ